MGVDVPFISTIIFPVAGSNYPTNPTKEEQATQVRAISHYELKKITRYFSKSNLIGWGSHAEVFLGELKDSQKCAVKMLDHPDAELDNEFLLKVMSAYSTLSTILDMALFFNIFIKP